MEIVISETKQVLGKKAAQMGAELIRKAILESGKANIIVATGASQFEMLSELVKADIDWSVVRPFIWTNTSGYRKRTLHRSANTSKNGL